MTSKGFADDVIEHVRASFDDPAAILEALAEAGVRDDRGARAVLYLANGSQSLFEHYAREAARDIYDVLLWAEYEDKIDGHPVKMRDMTAPLGSSMAAAGSASAELQLTPVSGALREDVEALTLFDHQVPFIATNTRSMQQADANHDLVPQAVFHRGRLIGFTMHEIRNPRVASVHRIMIDRLHQRQGFGRRALAQLMSDLTSAGIQTIYLSFRPENHAARAFFTAMGYVHEMDEPDGEVVFRFGPPLAI